MSEIKGVIKGKKTETFLSFKCAQCSRIRKCIKSVYFESFPFNLRNVHDALRPNK